MLKKIETDDQSLTAIAAEKAQAIVNTKLNRRQMMKLSALAPAGVIAANAGLNIKSAEAATPVSPKLTPWVDKLQIPPVAVPCDISKSEFFKEYPCQAHHHQGTVITDHPPQKFYHNFYKECKHKFHSELPENTVWGWDGNFAGPTYIARYGEPFLVRRTNMLDPNHVGFGSPGVSTHTHNLHVPSESDGNPEYQIWPGEYKDYHYPMTYAGFTRPTLDAKGNIVKDKNGNVIYQDRNPANNEPWEAQHTLWYHDHMLDFTSQNVYRGLAGFFLIYNEYDSGNENDTSATAFRLPSGEYDIPLIFIDMQFDANGTRLFDLFALDGFLGNKVTVNGKIQPKHEVAKRKYRLRLLNSGPSRHYEFAFNNKMPFKVVAIDGNFLEAPLTMTSVKLAPAERADIIVDFSTIPLNSSVYLVNTMEQVNGRGPTGKTLPVAQQMQLIRFDVNKTATDNSRVPAKFYSMPPIPAAKLAQASLSKPADRTFLFNRSNGAWTVNGKIFDPTISSASIKPNAEEVWEIQGAGDWSHPVHIHFEEFRIISRNGVKPPAQDAGRKDVIWLHPGEKVRIFMRFRDYEGRYVMHCHNVVHEDHAMMVRWDIGNPDPVPMVEAVGCQIDQTCFSKLCDGTIS